MEFQINKDFINHLTQLINEGNSAKIIEIFKEVHYADFAEFLKQIPSELGISIIRIVDSKEISNVIIELDEGTRKEILTRMSSEEIANNIDALESDDATDIILELSEEQKREVIPKIGLKHVKHILDLLRYEEDTAGGLMGKEFIKVNENWTCRQGIKRMRKQAEKTEKLDTIYVIDDDNILKGRLSLKSLLINPTETPIKDIYNSSISSVRPDEKAIEVAAVMQKYDLVAIAVIDEIGRLIGQITIDDVIDIIKVESEKDYQMAAGLTDDVEADATILKLTKARLPWLILGLLGGFCSGGVIGNFSSIFDNFPMLLFYTPLIAALAGNVGIQSSAIIVQSLAKKTIKDGLWNRFWKELILSLVNGIALGILIIGYGFLRQYEFLVSLTIAISLIIVIIIAALIGTFIPLILDRKGIDPAIATGPFITTSNDIFGIFIYFTIAKIMLSV